MKDRKKVLVIAVALVGLLGIVLSTVPFISSMSPNAKAVANLPRFKIPSLSPNSYTYVPHPQSPHPSPAQVLIVSRASGVLDYWYIPTIDGITAIAEIRYWRAAWICRDFSPDFDLNIITCKDGDIGRGYRPDVSWDLDGNVLSNSWWIPNLKRLEGRELNGDFVFLLPDAA